MNRKPPQLLSCGNCYGTCACKSLRSVADYLREEAAADMAEGNVSGAAENLAAARVLDRGL
ncbi:hypothetical protein GCM10023195_20680 [Actinoallomurus liliacearum]|uniref:Uncharacterized protein n=1 Tax=Actinoallomurus liliacearum TaxID=1080073 RepID=A0ABP8THD8_9ACTN